MRNAFLVAYDVADETRLRKTYNKLQGFGTPIQLSVFYCELSAMERLALQTELWDILNFDHDRVLIADLGPADENQRIEFWGSPRAMLPTRTATII